MLKTRKNKNAAEITDLSAHVLVKKIAAGEITCEQAAEAHLQRIREHNPAINAMVVDLSEEALRTARLRDRELSEGRPTGPLHGLPVTIKDHFAMRHVLSTNSHPPLAEYRPDQDATVAAKLREAGAVILGKTNLPQLAMDFQTRSPLHGITRNPRDLNRTPGGSSGGSAAALAAGFAPLEIGTDLAGSLRIPASFCGVCALKPSENRVSLHGVAPGLPAGKYRSFRHMANAGPMARNVRDLRLGLSVIAGPDGKDTRVIPNEITPPDESPAPRSPAHLSGMKIAWCESFENVPVARDIRRALNALAARLESAGAVLVKWEPSPDFLERAWKLFGLLLDMELNVHLPAPIRFMNFILGAGLRREVPQASMAYPVTFEKYMRALTEREDLIMELEEHFQSFDFFICPVTSVTAFPHQAPESQMGPVSIYKKPLRLDDGEISYYKANMSFTTPFSVTGHPVLSLPAGIDGDGLPIGAQIVASRWNDLALLRAGEIIEEILGLSESLKPVPR